MSNRKKKLPSLPRVGWAVSFLISKKAVLRHAKSQLGIQVYVVVPGKPVGGIELTVRHAHHLREAGGDVVDVVDDALSSDDVLCAGADPAAGAGDSTSATTPSMICAGWRRIRRISSSTPATT